MQLFQLRYFKPELALDKVHNNSKGNKSITFQQYVSREMALTVAWKNSDIFPLKLPRGGPNTFSKESSMDHAYSASNCK